ncbi:hypothetical protein GCM10009745_08900 [Kribbella yunnanensis]|uniref:Uncharacterized protein n=1 Tax=Kribbella yunnanensis TaxID=190194 RepID=A0ABN2GBS3_9ACTN
MSREESPAGNASVAGAGWVEAGAPGDVLGVGVCCAVDSPPRGEASRRVVSREESLAGSASVAKAGWVEVGAPGDAPVSSCGAVDSASRAEEGGRVSPVESVAGGAPVVEVSWGEPVAAGGAFVGGVGWVEVGAPSPGCETPSDALMWGSPVGGGIGGLGGRPGG